LRWSYVFLSIWICTFFVGLYLAPATNISTLVIASLINTIILYIIVYGITGIARRGIASKIFAIFLILLVAGLAYQNQGVVERTNLDSVKNMLASESMFLLGTFSNTVQSTSATPTGSLTGATSQTTGFASTIQTLVPQFFRSPNGTLIVTTWVHQLMANVSAARTSQGLSHLTESSSLDQWAQQRFLTMEQEPDVTHYGYQNQEPGVGEAILYPNGFSPSVYANDLQSQAPLHWQLLMYPSFISYGFYVGRGVVYSVGQQCSVTELPGPGINITQYFSQHGCTAYQGTDTWLVIELS
jgi:hypothetical protein